MEKLTNKEKVLIVEGLSKNLTLAGKAALFKTLREQLKAIEEQIELVRPDLEMAALEAGGTVEVEGYKISLSEASRENFALKAAKETLGDKILAPFIKICHFTQLRVVSK